MNKKYLIFMGALTVATALAVERVHVVTNQQLGYQMRENVVLAATIENNQPIINPYASSELKAPVQTVTLTATTELKKRSYMDNLIFQASRDNQLPEGLVKAVVEAESNFDVKCIGPDTDQGNAYGLMQLLPSTAKEVGITDLFDPEQNIKGGTKYLKMMIDRYSSKEYHDQNGELLTPYEMGVMAYNWGYPKLDKHIKANGCVVIAKDSKFGIPKETYGYLMKIRSNYDFNEYYN